MTWQQATSTSSPTNYPTTSGTPGASPTGNGTYPNPEGKPQSSRSTKPKRRVTRAILSLLALVVLGGGAAAIWYANHSGIFTPPRTDLVTHIVKPEKLQLTVVERGALESADNADVLCRVKAGNKGSTVATTIRWVIDDGTHVKKGQEVAKLDDSGLQEQLKTQRISTDKSRAEMIKAEEDYKITLSQNESDIKKAITDIELAILDLEKYKQGDYLQTQKDIVGRTSIAEADLDMSRDRASWSERMVKKGYFTPRQAEAEKSRLRSSQVSLDKVREESRVLEDFTSKRTVTDLESKLAEARRALDRIKAQASSKEVTSSTEKQTKRSVYEQELSRLNEIEEEIDKCSLFAPQDGMVVYFQSEQSRFGSGSQQSIVAQGEPVREGQKIMRIPDLAKMQVNTKVHEALVSRVKGEVWRPTGFTDAIRMGLLFDGDALSALLAQIGFTQVKDHYKDKDQKLAYEGQPAKVRIDAFPDRILDGHVKSVATVASQADWMSADVKVYQTIISVHGTLENLKPGMSSEVTILVDDVAKEVLAVPVQAIVPTYPNRSVYVMTEKGPEKRDIEVGLSNEKMAQIRTGLQEGDEVILNWRNVMSEKDRKQTAGPSNKVEFKGGMPQMPAGMEGKGKGRGKMGGMPGGAGEGVPGAGMPGGSGMPGGGGMPTGSGGGMPGGRGGSPAETKSGT